MLSLRPRLFLCLICTCALTLLSACSPDVAAPDPSPHSLVTAEMAVHRVCAGPTTVPGIDISRWQGTIDWDAVAASNKVGWAYVRIGDGLGNDSQFIRNWQETRRVGIPRGAYHFFRPARDALEQAQHFMDVVNSAGGHLPDDLPPMIDVEDDGGQSRQVIGDKMQIWMDYVEAQTGKRPIIYTGSYFWDSFGPGTRFADHHLWSPHYTTNPCPFVPDAWDIWTIWQYTDSGSVPGIAGNVDMNHFNGSLDDLTAWPACSAVRPISDCGAPDWWCTPIDALSALGILTRTCADFRGGDHFSRAEWAKLISNALNLSETVAYPLCRLPFSDITPDDWFSRDVASLAALDHGDGVAVFSTERTIFEPDRAPTRCEAAKMIAEAWDIPPAPDLTLLYPDADTLPDWCTPHVQRLANASLIAHSAADPFRPSDLTTAGEAATMLHNAITLLGRPTPSIDAFYEPSCRPPLTCEDQCTPGSLRCAGPDTESCALSTNGCADWQQPQRCPDKQVCASDPASPDASPSCVDVCDNVCSIGDLQCDGQQGFQTCEADARGCPAWGTSTACPGDDLCVGVGQCVDRCDLPSNPCDTSGASDIDTTPGSDLSSDGDIIGIVPPGTRTPDSCGCASLSAPLSTPRSAASALAALLLLGLAARRTRRDH